VLLVVGTVVVWVGLALCFRSSLQQVMSSASGGGGRGRSPVSWER
jgi:hypothetical protein